jgi:hypothetical protein
MKNLPVKAPPPPLRACPVRSGSSSGLSRNLPLRAGSAPVGSTAFPCQASTLATLVGRAHGRNAREHSAPCVDITLFEVPSAFAVLLGLSIA